MINHFVLLLLFICSVKETNYFSMTDGSWRVYQDSEHTVRKTTTLIDSSTLYTVTHEFDFGNGEFELVHTDTMIEREDGVYRVVNGGENELYMSSDLENQDTCTVLSALCIRAGSYKKYVLNGVTYLDVISFATIDSGLNTTIYLAPTIGCIRSEAIGGVDQVLIAHGAEVLPSNE
jgi:hypothetical protein